MSSRSTLCSIDETQSCQETTASRTSFGTITARGCRQNRRMYPLRLARLSKLNPDVPCPSAVPAFVQPTCQHGSGPVMHVTGVETFERNALEETPASNAIRIKHHATTVTAKGNASGSECIESDNAIKLTYLGIWSATPWRSQH
jgi:hypothetical protein